MIEQNLNKFIEQEPDKEQHIIVVFKPEMNNDLPEIKNAHKLMDNIFTANMTGEEIIKLSQNEAVVSIESDAEMSI